MPLSGGWSGRACVRSRVRTVSLPTCGPRDCATAKKAMLPAMPRKTSTPTIAKKPTMMRQSSRIVSAAMRAMAQHVIGEHHGHHRFADGHGADADAGIVAALGLHLDLVATRVDAFLRQEDRARRLHRKAHDNVLPGRDAAKDAAGIVREELDLAVLH